MRVIECDLCGAKADDYNYFIVRPVGQVNYNKERDLCYDCYMKLFGRTTDRTLK